MNMYGLGEGLDCLDREHNIMKHIKNLGGVNRTLPRMKTDLLQNELRNFHSNMNLEERNLLFHAQKNELAQGHLDQRMRSSLAMAEQAPRATSPKLSYTSPLRDHVVHEKMSLRESPVERQKGFLQRSRQQRAKR